MDILVYSDESGVFDSVHNLYFVFGGVVFLSFEERENVNRLYISVEKRIREKEIIPCDIEIKATSISNKSKYELFRSINKIEKFGVVINQRRLLTRIFSDKKTKQRYLDYAFKMAIKNKFKDLINKGKIDPSQVKNILFFVDEHTTATNGKYELRESLEQEFKYGTFNFKWEKFFPPLFENLSKVELKYCNSESYTLIRAADIVANRLYFSCQEISRLDNLLKKENFSILFLP